MRIIFIDFGAENVNGAVSRLVAFLGGNRVKVELNPYVCADTNRLTQGRW